MSRTVLITGGNKGIGLAATRLFVEHGDRVIVVARNARVPELASHASILCRDVDLTDIAAIPQLVRELGEIDVLVNNAGVMHSVPYDSYAEAKREQLMRLNIEAPVALIREVAPGMLARHAGRVVNVASIAGEIGHPDVWYGISKAGMINMTKTFAKLLGPGGIVVNAVAPGPVETDMLAVIPEPRKAAIKAAVYTGRFAYPEEVAQAIFWLGTDCPEYINGTCIDINNGAFPR